MASFTKTEIKYLYKELLKASKNEPRSLTKRFIKQTTNQSFHKNMLLVDPVEIDQKVNSGIAALRMIQIAQQTGKGGERRLLRNIAYIEKCRDHLSKVENKQNIQVLIDKQYKKYMDVVSQVLPIQSCINNNYSKDKKS